MKKQREYHLKNWEKEEIRYYKHFDAEFKGRNQESFCLCLKYAKYMISIKVWENIEKNNFVSIENSLKLKKIRWVKKRIWQEINTRKLKMIFQIYNLHW